MKAFITIFFLLISIISFGQNPQVDELNKLYMSGDYEETIFRANEFLKNEPNNIDFNLILGRALTDKNDFKTAIPYLELTVKNDKSNSWRKAWALNYLGTCYFMMKNYCNSKSSLNECIKLKATKNVTNSAYKQISLFGYNKFYNNWKTVETDNMIFHFQKMDSNSIEKFISTREEAFVNINNFFNSNLPKKIDFFVWDSNNDAKKLLKTSLGFAHPRFCIVHSHYQQTKGHEIAHVISHYSTKIIYKTGLITEGVAVCFDQTNQNKETIVKDWLKAHNKKISIIEVWTNWNAYPEQLTYPLSGIFVKYLIENFGKDKFIEFYNNQTYDNAKAIFGDNFDKIVNNFENKINT